MSVNKLGFVIVILACFLVASSFAGRQSKLVEQPVEDVTPMFEEKPLKPSSLKEETAVHERLLRANRKDYGRYDPSPTFVKPPFKLIPN